MKLHVYLLLFCRSKQLNIFTAEKCENGCRLIENTQNALDVEPWDICFISNRLWVLQPCENSPVLVYNCVMDDKGNVKVRKLKKSKYI